MNGILIGFAIIAFVILVGYVVGRTGVAGEGSQRALNRVAFFVANPALLFTVLATADMHIVFSTFVAIALISTLVAFGTFALVNRLFFHLPFAEATIGSMASGYVNANNIGLPVAVYVLGSGSYVAPVLLLQLIVFAPVILTILDISSRGRISIVSILSQPLRNPMIIASVLGVIVDVTGLHLPPFVLQPITLLGGAAVPLVLMSFGMSLYGARPLRAGSGRAQIIAAAILKSFAMPAVAWILAQYVFGLQGHQLLAAVAIAALPAAQNVYNFASRYDVGLVLARDTVLLTTALAVPVLVLVTLLLA
jgi:malonate transporter